MPPVSSDNKRSHYLTSTSTEKVEMSPMPPTGAWKVVARNLVRHLETHEAGEPWLAVHEKLHVRAECPNGHSLPADLFITRPIVEHFAATPGVTVGCGACGLNYYLPTGEWPATL